MWMRYMRFVRRSDSIPASRKLFMRARRWPPCGWQVCCPLRLPVPACCTADLHVWSASAMLVPPFGTVAQLSGTSSRMPLLFAAAHAGVGVNAGLCLC